MDPMGNSQQQFWLCACHHLIDICNKFSKEVSCSYWCTTDTSYDWLERKKEWSMLNSERTDLPSKSVPSTHLNNTNKNYHHDPHYKKYSVTKKVCIITNTEANLSSTISYDFSLFFSTLCTHFSQLHYLFFHCHISLCTNFNVSIYHLLYHINI